MAHQAEQDPGPPAEGGAHLVTREEIARGAWLDRFGRKRIPRGEIHRDDGTVEAVDVVTVFNAWREQDERREAKRQAAIRRLTPEGRRAYLTYLRTGRRPAARPTAPAVRVAHGARQQSGRPRASAARSSARSGDSGDDGPGEPPAGAAAAVAAAWACSLRTRRPDLAWTVERPRHARHALAPRIADLDPERAV